MFSSSGGKRRGQPVGNSQQDLDLIVGVDLGRPMSLFNLALDRRRNLT